MKKHLDRFTLGDYEGIILNTNKTIDKNRRKTHISELLLDFLYSF